MNTITKLAFSALTLSLLAGCGRELPTEPEDRRQQSKVANSLAAQQDPTNADKATIMANNEEKKAPVIKVNERRQGKVAVTLAAQQWKVSPSQHAIMSGSDAFKFTSTDTDSYTLQALQHQTWQATTGCTVDKKALSLNASKAVQQLKKGNRIDCGEQGSASLLGFTAVYDAVFTQ